MLTKRTTILLSVLLCGVFLSSSCTVSSPASGSSAVTETGTLSRVTTAAVAAGTRAPRWHMDEAKTRAVPTLDELTRISTRIFRGTYLYSEAIPGVSGSLQDVFQVQSIEKDLIPIEGKTVAAMRKSSSPVSLAVDRCYLVFTDFADASVYPTPSFHTLALFPLESDGSMNSAYTSGQMLDLFPFLIETRLTKDIVSATRHSSGIQQYPDYPLDLVPDSFASFEDQIRAADWIVTAQLFELTGVLEEVHPCMINPISLLASKNGRTMSELYQIFISLPYSPDQEEEYLLFLNQRGEGVYEVIDLVARNGAVIAKSDADAWNTAIKAVTPVG